MTEIEMNIKTTNGGYKLIISWGFGSIKTDGCGLVVHFRKVGGLEASGKRSQPVEDIYGVDDDDVVVVDAES